MKRILILFPFIVVMFLMVAGCDTNASSAKLTEQHSDPLDVTAMKKIVEERNLAYDKAFVEEIA